MASALDRPDAAHQTAPTLIGLAVALVGAAIAPTALLVAVASAR